MKRSWFVVRGSWFVAATLAVAAIVAARADDAITPQVQSAVDRGLSYLAQKQDSTGMFPSNLKQSTAVTSLAAMAFLSRGHVPGQGPYGDVVNHAIDFVLSCQHEDGLLSSTSGNTTMYDHGISTVMLCEAYGMVDDTRRNKIQVAVAKAVKLIVDAQRIRKRNANDQGGWRYSPKSPDSDISVSGWQLMALRGAANIGADVPAQTVTDGVEYMRRRATPSGGFSYQGNRDPSPACTGTGILSLELLGKHQSPEALAGGDYLLQFTGGRGGQQHNSYTIYYCSQAANQLGGKYWDGIYKPIQQSVLASQQPDGSWAASDGDDQQAGQIFSTSMCILVLTVPYHYLPLYQK